MNRGAAARTAKINAGLDHGSARFLIWLNEV